MHTQRVIIELSPSRVEVATVRAGKVAEFRCERSDRAEWPSPYTTALPDVADALTKLLSEMEIAEAHATVIYSAPGSVSGMTSCSTSINAGGAEQAAMLSLANLADFSIEDSPADTCTVFVDKRVRHPGADAPAAQRHIVACAESEDRASALCSAIAGCGLHVDRMIPAESVAVADAIRLATGTGTPEEISAVLWIGEHSATLAVGSPGRLYFARTIATGTEALVEVLCRPLRARSPESPAVTLVHPEARKLLLTTGVPAADANIEGHPTLAGSALLPHLQPILQRLSIEIKQSLRFGVPEIERPRLRIRLSGPGAAVPGLGDALARGSGFPFSPEVLTGAHGPDALDSSTGGLIAALTHCPAMTLGILPTEARQQALLRGGRKALMIGAALALAYVGYETFDAYSTLRRERGKLETVTAALRNTQAPLAVRQAAIASRAALSDAEARLRHSMAQAPDWSMLMAAIAEGTPKDVRITTLEMTHDANKSGIELRAYIRFDENPDPTTTIRAYVRALEAVPLIEGVRLGATQRSQQAGHESQSFSLTLGVVSLPPGATLGALQASHDPEGK